MEEDVVVVEFDLLASNIKRKVYNVLEAFISFLKKFDERKTHNMLALILNMRYKNLKIIFTFVVKELKVTIVKDYDKKVFFLMILKTHYILHPWLLLNLWQEDQMTKTLTLTFLRWFWKQLNLPKSWWNKRWIYLGDILNQVPFGLVG